MTTPIIPGRYMLNPDGSCNIYSRDQYDWCYTGKYYKFVNILTNKPVNIEIDIPYFCLYDNIGVYNYYIMKEEGNRVVGKIYKFHEWYNQLNEQQQKCYLQLKFEGLNI